VTTVRRQLLLYTARYGHRQNNAVAATLSWAAAAAGSLSEVYYDAPRAGGHYGGGDLRRYETAELSGGLVVGGRHIEALEAAANRFDLTAVVRGDVMFSPALERLACDGRVSLHRVGEEDVAGLYDDIFQSLGIDWPDTAVLVNAHPSTALEGIDAYLYPEIVYRRAVGLEASVPDADVCALLEHGCRQILAVGVSDELVEHLQDLGFSVTRLDVIQPGDDYSRVTARLAHRWESERRGWLLGDPVLVSSWLPTAVREDRIAIYGVPQSTVIDRLSSDIAATATPILGRQFEDSDFFRLSELGQSFQLIDPARPPLPVLSAVPSTSHVEVSTVSDDPSDEDLRAWVSQGRVLTSLVFWTGMLREMENLYAVLDLLALTGVRAGLALTAQSLLAHPSPLDLVSVSRDQGGVFPHAEILLASCGTGAAIESLLTPDQLGRHLGPALQDVSNRVAPALRPTGWWATMDAPLVSGDRPRLPLDILSHAPFMRLRFTPRGAGFDGAADPGGTQTAGWRSRVRQLVRDSRLSPLFEAYRPYEHFAPGPLSPSLALAVQGAGFSYMLSKSGFGDGPAIQYRDGDFVAINYTSGHWDGWTPFETVNHVRDLERAEQTLLRSRQPGWLLGGLDTCLWAFSGTIWDRAPGLAAIARFVSSGGQSGRLINVRPCVLPRYARIMGDQSGTEAGNRLTAQV